MASRSLDDLLPAVAEKFKAWVAACEARGVTVLPYCTYRSPEEQAAEYAKGRTVRPPYHTTTDAQPWQSWHQMRRAADCVPVTNGKAQWEPFLTLDRLTPEWHVLVDEAAKAGIEWAGNWTTFVEYVHWQVTDGLTLEQARAQVERGGV